MVYLDNAATTLRKPSAVARAVCAALRMCGSAGRGGHPASQNAAEVLFCLRQAAARRFGMQNPERVILTHNATHALNIAIRALAVPGRKVLISGYEHNAVVRPLADLRVRGVETEAVATPLFDADAFADAFCRALEIQDVGLAVCTHVSNVFGFVLPIDAVAAACGRRGVPLVVDASQSAGILPIGGDSTPIWCMPGHKGLHGPQGTGLLLLPPQLEDTALTPLIFGGTGGDSRPQTMPGYPPDRLEAGTHNIPGAAGLCAALNAPVRPFPNHLLCKTTEGLAKHPEAEVFFDPTHQTGAISFRLRNEQPERTAERLAAREICVRAGLHCAPLAHQTAGTGETGTVRVSLSADTTEREIDLFLEAV